MTTEEALAAVEAIKNCKGDDEVAHGEEDALHQAILEHIKEHGDDESAELARIALLTCDIEFSRWCA